MPHDCPISSLQAVQPVLTSWPHKSGVILRKMNDSVVTMLSLLKVTTRKKCWNERENWHQLAAKPRTTYAPMRGFSSPSQPTRLEQFALSLLIGYVVPNDEMVQLTFVGVPLTAAT